MQHSLLAVANNCKLISVSCLHPPEVVTQPVIPILLPLQVFLGLAAVSSDRASPVEDKRTEVGISINSMLE